MSRIQNLVSSPKRTLAALATVLVAVGITAASGASFNATSANANNTFTAGTMSMGNTPSMATLSTGNMKPGDPATTGTVMIKNDGSLGGAFKLSTDNLLDTPNPLHTTSLLSDRLHLVVTDCGVALLDTDPDPVCAAGDTDKYDNTLGSMPSTGLGNIPAGARHLYKFSVDLPLVTSDFFQGASTKVDFKWDAS
jgi:hypothetical protein